MGNQFLQTQPMTLRQFMVKRRYAYDENAKKCRCPFHGDSDPSAYLNDNHIYCYTCHKSYTISDFSRKFNVQLTYVAQENKEVGAITRGGEVFPPGTILFSYPFDGGSNG